MVDWKRQQLSSYILSSNVILKDTYFHKIQSSKRSFLTVHDYCVARDTYQYVEPMVDSKDTYQKSIKLDNGLLAMQTLFLRLGCPLTRKKAVKDNIVAWCVKFSMYTYIIFKMYILHILDLMYENVWVCISDWKLMIPFHFQR